MTRLHFDQIINLGHLISFGTFIVTLLAISWWQSNFQTKTEERLKASELAREQYVPMINDIVAIHGVTNQQVSNINTILIGMQKTNQEQTEAISLIRERLSYLEANSKDMPK